MQDQTQVDDKELTHNNQQLHDNNSTICTVITSSGYISVTWAANILAIVK